MRIELEVAISTIVNENSGLGNGSFDCAVLEMLQKEYLSFLQDLNFQVLTVGYLERTTLGALPQYHYFLIAFVLNTRDG